MLQITHCHDLTARDEADARQLLNLVWPPGAGEDAQPLHDAALAPQSFLARRDGQLLAYAAVLQKTIHVAGRDYLAAGLSCVACHPAWRGFAYGAAVVACATQWLCHSGADLGLFTCDRALAPFYRRHGWPQAADVLLLAHRGPGAISSRDGDKVVLLRLLSPRAQARAEQFHHTTLSLDLPAGQFW